MRYSFDLSPLYAVIHSSSLLTRSPVEYLPRAAVKPPAFLQPPDLTGVKYQDGIADGISQISVHIQLPDFGFLDARYPRVFDARMKRTSGPSNEVLLGNDFFGLFIIPTLMFIQTGL